MAGLNCERSNWSKKVRVIGKIRGFTDKESGALTQSSKPWITVKKAQEYSSSEKCTMFFETQSTSRNDGYELDYCYEQDEDIGHIYLREIKPLILEAFDGRNSSIIALGAKGSGKTQTIQGSQEKPGLAVMAMSEILSKANELGLSVSISLYELRHDNAYDLLNPMRPAVQVLDDAKGKINLKGLSQVSVKSISEFRSIYFSQGCSQNTQRLPMDQPRNHKGLMVHISSEDNKLKPNVANKINFVDLTGYEDPRKSSNTVAENNRTNKSLYALLSVVSAINMNESRVPYRASKLTRILQDCLGGTSHILLLTCLNPLFCQDSLSSTSLVSRSCRITKQVLTDSTNRSQSAAKVKGQSSIKAGKTMSASLSVKKQIGHNHLLSGKKASCILNGRKLFDEEKLVNPKQLRCQSEDTSAQKTKILPNVALDVPPFSLENAPQDNVISECSPPIEPTEVLNCQGHDKATIHSGNLPEATPCTESVPNALMAIQAASTCDENNTSHKINDAFLQVTEGIREVYNNLKSVYDSTPLRIKMPEESQVGFFDVVDPKTPVLELKSASYCSPRGTFSNRSSRVKNSLVQEYLNFLNSANKEELKSLKGIGEKRATYILELREESPQPFKDIDDLQDIGLSAKQIKGMMKQVAGELFN